MRKILIISLLFIPLTAHGESDRYTGAWLNRNLSERLASGIEPRIALKDCGRPTVIRFIDSDELLMSWNNHEGSPMLFELLEDGSLETLGMTPNGIKIGMRYRMHISMREGLEVLSVECIEPVEQQRDELIRYPDRYDGSGPPQGMIIDIFLSGKYSLVGCPDSLITIHADGSVEGCNPFRSLSVGFDCVEESSQNHVYFHRGEKPERNPRGESFVWELSGDTLTFYEYHWEDVLFYGSVGEEYLRLLKR